MPSNLPRSSTVILQSPAAARGAAHGTGVRVRPSLTGPRAVCQKAYSQYGHQVPPSVVSHRFLARRAGIPSDARDRLLGHRPRDTKALHYEDVDLPLLAAEVAKLPSLDAGHGNEEEGDDGGAGTRRHEGEPLENRRSAGVRTPSGPKSLVRSLVLVPTTQTTAAEGPSMFSAEEVRFELTDGLPRRRFSKPLPSTTRPLLRRAGSRVAQGSRPSKRGVPRPR